MSRRRVRIAALLPLLLALPAFAQEEAPKEKEPPVPEAREQSPAHDLFDQAARAITNAGSISYHAKSYAKGGLIESLTPTVEADVQQIRALGGAIPGWRVRSTGTSRPRSDAPVDFDVAWLAATVEFVDHGAKKVVERTLLDARKHKPFTASNPAKIDEFTAARPFTRELAAKDVAIEGRETFGGVECDVVAVTTGKIRTRWWIATSDRLPRKSERIIGGGGQGDASMFVEVTDLRLNASPQDAAGNLRVPVPEGYTEDRAAPPRPTPPKSNPAGTPVKGAEGAEGDGGGGGGGGGATRTAPPVPEVPAGPRPAPDFSLKTPAGETVTLSSLKGSVVVLEFAGTWAISLRDARPELEAFVQAHKDRPVRVFSLAVREKSKEKAIEDFRKGGFTFGLLLDADETARAYRARTFPSYAVVNPAGDLVMEPSAYVKGDTMKALRDATAAALGGGTAPGGMTPPTPPIHPTPAASPEKGGSPSKEEGPG